MRFIGRYINIPDRSPFDALLENAPDYYQFPGAEYVFHKSGRVTKARPVLDVEGVYLLCTTEERPIGGREWRRI